MGQVYGRKIGMTRYFTETGESVPVTVILAEPNVVFQVKTTEKEGYNAVQIGFGKQKQQRLTRAVAGHVAKAKRGTPRFLREVPVEGDKTFNVGDEIKGTELFQAGAAVDVMGISIGKGYQGVMKRHHMKGQPATRGTHEMERHGGSIGCRKFPGRVFKNKRMAGHMGTERVTQLNLKVVAVKPEENLLLIQGSVPGPKNGVVLVRDAIKGAA